MTETKPNEPGIPQVKDKRVIPPGILPKNTQTILVCGIALVMVLVIAFSGRNTPKPRNPPPEVPKAPIDPNQMRIEEYKKRIEEQTRKIENERAILAREQEMTLAGETTQETPRPYASPRGGADIDRDPQRNVVQDDKAKREYASLFASNVALTFRKDAAAGESIPSPDFAKLLSLYPALAAMQAAGLSGTAQPKPPAQPVPTPSANEAADVKTSEDFGSKKQKYRLYEGEVLETVLTNRLDSSFSGPVNCMVTTNVYSRNGQHLLIPQGSRILGEARKVEAFGQNRLAVVFHRLIMPNGSWITLDQFHGLNQIGETGLADQNNHHYFQVFGVSIAIGAIAGLGQANTRTGLDQSGLDAYQQGVSTSLSQSSLRILDRYLNVLPTITIREGQRVKVLLSADLLLPAYEDSTHS